MADVLNDEQFAAAGSVPGGGATRRVDTHEVAPSTGVYVSTEAPEAIVPSPISGAMAHAHEGLIKQAHAAPSYQGVWNSGDAETKRQGPVYLDHSRRYLSPRLAHFKAAARNQLAMYDATADKVRDTHDPETLSWVEKSPRPKA